MRGSLKSSRKKAKVIKNNLGLFSQSFTINIEPLNQADARKLARLIKPLGCSMEFDELWNSVSEDRGVDELRRYLRDGGSVNVRHSDSTWTLVHLACEHMNLDLIRTLSEAGADQNARDRNQGWTPLHLAVDTDIDSVWQAENSFSQLTFSTTRLLLALGADPTIRDNEGNTPRDIAAGYGTEVLNRYDNLTSASS